MFKGVVGSHCKDSPGVGLNKEEVTVKSDNDGDPQRNWVFSGSLAASPFSNMFKGFLVAYQTVHVLCL